MARSYPFAVLVLMYTFSFLLSKNSALGSNLAIPFTTEQSLSVDGQGRRGVRVIQVWIIRLFQHRGHMAGVSFAPCPHFLLYETPQSFSHFYGKCNRKRDTGSTAFGAMKEIMHE